MTKPKATKNSQALKDSALALPVKKPRDPSTFSVVDDGRPMPEVMAQLSSEAAFLNGNTARTFVRSIGLGDIDSQAYIEQTRDRVKKVNDGDMSGVEAMLVAQAVALDGLFNALASRAGRNMGEHLTAAETYMRLALKAQGQCRATLQTLGEIKAPRQVAFIKQANLAQGNQQVNNGVAAPAQEIRKPTSELLEVEDGTRLDTGTTGAAIGADSGLAALDAINRAKIGAGEGAGGAQQPEARRTVQAGH